MNQKESGNRITPTCVGKRVLRTGTPDVWKDHPHLRGEKPTYTGIADICRGSPPLAWGKGFLMAIAINRTEDHPHLRGEKLSNRSMPASTMGSPPLAWGKVTAFWGSVDRNRITPTCVGKRRCSWLIAPATQDHPHLRGEKESKSDRATGFPGSPPLAWGKDRYGRPIDVQLRITPTCVGKRLA